jgi:hypothetical protein
MQENMEDILTSNVFGLMQYFPARDALVPFLRHAETMEGLRPFAALSSEVKATYSFWPRISEPGCHFCEPDVMIRLECSGEPPWLMFVEAKYLSGKSSEEDASSPAPCDQLAREWDNLASMAGRQSAEPLLLYVTADIGLPRQDLAASAKEHSDKRSSCSGARPFTCAWLSWRQLSVIFQRAHEAAMCDLRAMADRLSLFYFEKLTPFDAEPLDAWRFGSVREFSWKAPGKTAEIWSFGK